jgi:hypothetical protein
MVLRFHAVQRCRLLVALIVLAALASGWSLGSASAQNLTQLTGVWRGAELTPLGLSSIEVIFFPNGTYSRSHVLGVLMTRDAGRYEVVSNWVHFYLQEWAPTEYLGRPLTWPTSDTWIVTRFDGQVLETSNIHVTRTQ